MSTASRTATLTTVVTLGAVLALALMLALPPEPLGLIAAAPLALVFIAGMFGMSRWPLFSAILLLLYFTGGVMDILTDPAGRGRAILFTVLTLVGFFAALDRFRRG